MKFCTVHEMAQKWGISERLVQKYCAQGRIDGAKKFGISWRIPEQAEKPRDPRKKKEEQPQSLPKDEISFSRLMPLLNTPFQPGHCMEYIQSIEDKEQKNIAMAEYYYFSGHPEEAIKEAELYLTSSDLELRLSACFLCAYANLTIGQIHKARYALTEINKLLSKNENITPQMRAAGAFVASSSAILLHLPLPEKLPPMKQYVSLLPPGLRVFVLYVQAHYAYLKKEYGRSLGIVEATLSMGKEIYPIPTIYLHLVAVMSCLGLRQIKQAEAHLLAAWKLAQPDDLIEGFGEHHGLLGGMLEAVIKKQWPEDFKRMIAITYRFSAGWRKIHNPDTGHDVADNLTTTEFAVAMLASRGWTNQEIGEHMNISPNTVKRHISIALQKLNIKHRQDLKQYMLN